MIDVKYIEFLDSDDFLESDCINIVVQYAQQYHLDLVCAGINQVSDKYKKITSTFWLLEKIEKNKILAGIEIIKKNKYNFFYGVSNILINFNFLNNINLKFIDGIIYEDHHFGTVLFLRAKKIMIINEFLLNYVNSINSTTRPKKITQERIFLDFISWKLTIKNLEQDIQTYEEKKIIHKYIKKFYVPMMYKNLLKLDSNIQNYHKKNIKEYKKYITLKIILMLYTPNLFFLLKKIKKIFIKR